MFDRKYHLRIKSFWIGFSWLFLLFLFQCCNAMPYKRVAFYYGDIPPFSDLRLYDVVVVAPNDHINPHQYAHLGNKIFAYVTIGEVNRHTFDAKRLPKQCIIGHNKIWNADIVDQGQTTCRQYYLKHVIAPLWKKGYQGLFLDTLDSYRLVLKSKKDQSRYVEGLVTLIQAIKKQYPSLQIILNRGFELLPKVHQLISAVAGESLYKGWDQQKKRYVNVSPKARAWLLEKFKEAQSFGLPVISIEYLPKTHKKAAELLAEKIQRLGFFPWITNKDLSIVGESDLQLLPRKIMVFYDSVEYPQVIESAPLRYAAMPLAYLGYVPIYKDVRKYHFNAQPLGKRYAGILVWLNTDYLELHPTFQSWLVRQIKHHIPVVVLGELGTSLTTQFLKTTGLKVLIPTETSNKISVTYRAPLMRYEIFPQITSQQLRNVQLARGTPLLTLRLRSNQRSTMVAATPWGGYALNPYVIVDLPNGELRWVMNPLTFFHKAFQLKAQPIPDVTTENGLRLMMVHIDGDGFPSRADWDQTKFAGEVLFNEILNHYRIPTTVSVIQAEVATNGLYKRFSLQLEAIARSIFKLPWVEIASHSFSHPFAWQHRINGAMGKGTKNQAFYLPVPNYTFNLETEITKSVRYIDQHLAPAGKQCKVFLWTGDCNPSETAVALTYHNHLRNMNGGGATITNAQNSLTNIAGLGIYRRKYFQVFAPNQNENMYTNLWTGPFYGYRRVIETFELTDRPIRFKPIDIYYHFYSATKKASLNALKAVYDWALKQDVFNIFVSEYVDKVLDFNRLVIGQKGAGWLIRTNGNLREFRLPTNIGFPDLTHSMNVVGYKEINGQYYVHLGEQKTSYIVLTKQASHIPYLVDANGRIEHFSRTRDGLSFKLVSHMPLRFSLANVNQEQLRCNGQLLQGRLHAGISTFALQKSTVASCLLQTNH